MDNQVAKAKTDVAAPSNVTNMFEVLQRAASDPNVDPDKIERLYEIMDRERKSEAERQFNAAMVQVQQAVEPIHKNQTNKQTKSTYADLGQIADAVNKVFTSHGFSLRFSEAESGAAGVCRVQCKMSHEAGHTEVEWADIPISVEGTGGTRMMTDTHGKGSAFTYGRRYLTLMLANIPTSDDDGNAASRGVEYVSDEQAKEIETFFDIDGDGDWRDEVLHWLKVETPYEIEAKNFNAVRSKIKKAFNMREQKRLAGE